jgi:hypothetical protein
MQARFDKHGKRLPDSGHGCGCNLCAESQTARYERRRATMERTSRPWSPMRRSLVRLVRALMPVRTQVT